MDETGVFEGFESITGDVGTRHSINRGKVFLKVDSPSNCWKFTQDQETPATVNRNDEAFPSLGAEVHYANAEGL